MAKGIGIGIGVLVGVAVVVFVFTNVGDILSQEITELTSKIKISNPIQPYKINTKCELIEFFNEPGNTYKAFDLILQNPLVLEQRYYEKGGNKQDLSQSHLLIREISAEIIAEEYSINPVLKGTLIDLTEQQTALEWNAKLKSLGSDCNAVELFENQDSNIYTVMSKNAMRPALKDGDDVVVDKTIHLTELKEGDIIIYKSNYETDPFRFSRVIAADPDSGNISTKLDMQRYPIHHDYPNGKNEFIGKVVEIIRDGKKVPLSSYIPNNHYKLYGPKNSGALGSDHAHAAILVKIFGDKFDFSAPAYQIKTSWIHFEGRDGTTIHKHATGVTLGYLFETLGLGLDEKCFDFIDGRSFCTNDEYSLKFYINGKEVSDIRDYEITDGDRILISYGEGTPRDIERQLQELENQQILG